MSLRITPACSALMPPTASKPSACSFKPPINRRLQRNNYRADQIAYQRARRIYMDTRDTVVQQIRLDMRQLTLQRRVFEINREQIIIAARQLEIAEYNLRASTEARART